MPSTINKDSLLSQVDSIIDSLNLSTDETSRLALFYKSALNAGSNTIYSGSNVAVELVSRAANTTSTDSKELLMLATGAGQVTDDRVVTVANTTVLNALANVSTGTIYFVESDGYPYIRKSDNTWTPLTKGQKVYNAWSWGQNNFGQLGDGTTTNSSSPVSVLGGFTDWVYLDGGSYSSHGIRANGTLWSWGRNSTSQLGDGTTTHSSSPVSVLGGFTDWTQVTGSGTGAGRTFTIALRGNGTLWSWGTNQDGVLGHGFDGGTVASPKSVIGGFTDWTKVSSGLYHTVALRSNGTIWCWGRNEQGQLGENGVVGSRINSPVSVVGGFTDWVNISAGIVHSLGIRSNGTLWAWGNNGNGQLGDNTTSNKSSPVSVVGGFTDWIGVSGGNGTSMALRSNGTLWGIGTRTGDGTSTNRSSPVSVVGGFTDWVVVSCGFNHSIGLRANGTLWAWGTNNYGRLGDGTTTTQLSPVAVIGGFTDWIFASVGGAHSVGLRA